MLMLYSAVNKSESLRSSERGLKCSALLIVLDHNRVAPFVGAWIEISLYITKGRTPTVAPFVGAWIEMLLSSHAYKPNSVAPFVGAWIEMRVKRRLAWSLQCRSVRRSVD